MINGVDAGEQPENDGEDDKKVNGEADGNRNHVHGDGPEQFESSRCHCFGNQTENTEGKKLDDTVCHLHHGCEKGPEQAIDLILWKHQVATGGRPTTDNPDGYRIRTLTKIPEIRMRKVTVDPLGRRRRASD